MRDTYPPHHLERNMIMQDLKKCRTVVLHHIHMDLLPCPLIVIYHGLALTKNITEEYHIRLGI
jgi:hypothetical protein